MVAFLDGSTKTLGIMLPGDFEFYPEDKKLMEIPSGKLEIQLPDSEWQTITAGDNFEVPARSKFQLKIKTITDYCCNFIKE